MYYLSAGIGARKGKGCRFARHRVLDPRSDPMCSRCCTYGLQEPESPVAVGPGRGWNRERNRGCIPPLLPVESAPKKLVRELDRSCFILTKDMPIDAHIYPT
jgi:hypothetical protein